MIEIELKSEDVASHLTHISDPALLGELERSDIVILPESVDQTDSKVVFRPGSKEFLDYLSDHLKSQLRVDIATEDDKYVEQLLHAADIWLPTLLLLVENPLMKELALITAAHFILEKLRGLGRGHIDHTRDIEPYWPNGRVHVNNRYRDLEFPWPALAARPIEMTAIWTRDELVGYITTWSATARFVADRGEGRLDELRQELAATWPDDEPRTVSWALTIKLARR